MKIKHVTKITLTPEEVKEIIKEHFAMQYEIDDVEFVIGTLPDDDSLYSSYQMTKVQLTANKLYNESEDKLSWT